MEDYLQTLFCEDLPTKPNPGMGTILVTGATGYIGGRLVPELIARGYKVRCMIRGSTKGYKAVWPEAELVSADALDRRSLKKALKGVHTAYYLIHSLLLGPREFEQADIQAAINFREIAEQCKVKRIIYLGGLGDFKSTHSRHLQSRIQVAEELRAGKVPVTILLAAVIIGSGSASYEIIHHLVRRMWILPVPKWAENRCQPISIRDVVKYLVGSLESGETSGKVYNIGGPDVLTYREMIATFAKILNRRIFIFRSLISNIRLYSYFSSLLTPVPAQLTSCLMEGLKDEVVCKETSIRDIINFEPLSYRAAVVRALTREEQDMVSSRWSDSYPPAHALAIKLNELDHSPRFIRSDSLITRKSRSDLFKCICKIGGQNGWFYNNWMWRMRGLIDKIFMGAGTLRGRRSRKTLKVNDVVDFWRVEEIKDNDRLLLRAEMKLPGKGWLEFSIDEIGRGARKLSSTAYFDTNSLFGHMYWYAFTPFHHYIFTHLIEQIERRS